MTDTQDIRETPDYIAGPFHLQLTVALTNGKQTAQVGLELGKGQLLYKGALKKKLKEAEDHIKLEMGDDWKLCTNDEYWGFLLQQANLSSFLDVVPTEGEA